MISYLYPPTPVSVSVPPLSFELNGVDTPVAQDTANAANNTPLPTGVFFIKDGIAVPVSIDTVTPANNVLLPVEISSLSGPINITAGDLNVSTSSTNDSMAIGDGVTGLLANVTTNGTTGLEELHVVDDGANTLLGTIDADTSALSATIGTPGSAHVATGVQVLGSDGTNNRRLLTDATGVLQVNATASALPTGAATLAEQQLQTTELVQISTDTLVLQSAINSDGNPIGATGIAIGGRDGSGDFQQVVVNPAGELSVTFGSAGFATETTLSALNNKVANNYGAASGAVRSASQVGNATGAADFNSGADSAQTLRVSANLKRAGNELSYNSGAADANTLRNVLATRHEAETTPLSVRLTDGTDWLTSSTLNGTNQKVISTNGKTLKVAAFALGFSVDNADHREIAVDSNGLVKTVSQPKELDCQDARSVIIGSAGVTSISIPAGTVKFKVMAMDSNSVNLRMRVGNDPTAAAGMQFQPGRSEDFECVGADLRFIAETTATNQAVEVFFFTV